MLIFAFCESDARYHMNVIQGLGGISPGKTLL